jgi:hypothetical protein
MRHISLSPGARRRGARASSSGQPIRLRATRSKSTTGRTRSRVTTERSRRYTRAGARADCPQAKQDAAGAAADERHLCYVWPNPKGPQLIFFSGPLVPGYHTGHSVRSICTVHYPSNGNLCSFWIVHLCTFFSTRSGRARAFQVRSNPSGHTLQAATRRRRAPPATCPEESHCCSPASLRVDLVTPSPLRRSLPRSALLVCPSLGHFSLHPNYSLLCENRIFSPSVRL